MFVVHFGTLANEPKIEIIGSNYSFSIGEEPDWGEPDLTSSDGSNFFDIINGQKIEGVFWIRWDMNVVSGANPERDLEYYLSVLAAYEVFWDGQLVGRNGTPGKTIKEEVPGEIETVFLVPNDWIKPGINQALFKFSSHHRPAGYPLFRHAFLENFNKKKRYISIGSLLPTLLISIALIIGFYFIALFLSDRKNIAYLIFSALCFNLFVFGLSLQWPHLIGYTYNWAIFNDIVAYTTGAIIPFLLPLFFLHKFALTKYWPAILVIPLSIILFLNLENGTKLYWVFGLVFSAVIVSYVVWRERGGYWWELCGLIVCIIGMLDSETSLEDFFYFFPLIVLFILVTNAIEAQRLKMASFRFKLKSSQLEAQLLRKNIQPHFILNSLASLVEWVETAPEKSVEFISALADEFRLFAEISGKDLISITKEKELCEQHLSIMQFRLQHRYTMSCEGFEQTDMLPPGIIHTLIENAFSHNDYTQADVKFHLSKIVCAEKLLFVFSAPYIKHKSSKFEHLGTGTGTTYIHSQLTQSYGSKWKIDQQQESETWITKITIPLNRVST
jgi:hypothetical protein